MTSRRVLQVGNCSFDGAAIAALIGKKFGAQVVAADRQEGALEMLRGEAFDLVLVNRKLEVDRSEGLDLVKRIKADTQLASTPVMLLSNYAEAQRAAVAGGAEPGFGKAELAADETVEKLARFLA
jgi:CheY-like chemotaxis protein